MAAVKVLVTGATGKVGNAVARALAERGDEVRALVRDQARARSRAAARGRDRAGRRDRSGFGGERRRGLRAGLQRDGHPRAVAGRRVACSTASTRRERRRWRERLARPACGGWSTPAPRTSSTPSGARASTRPQVADYPKGTAYERSKQRAEQLALEARDGLEVVIVNPSGVYGPGPVGDRLDRQGLLRAAGAQAAAGAAAGRPRRRLRRRRRERASAGRRQGPRRRALHPLRPPRHAARAGADGRPGGRPRAGASHPAATARARDGRRAARRCRR